ncbi:longitudinals lacking protein, isoforms A/B/D/L-like isoform X2 [Bacillus rossius redtenbacheri]|uniref:longitudinals lacking protein, isoforms A/B/D/L-like isoform X2 n=1 Tax=Bacillus rossius redtenbacheri TaxID=93214 RepID=UPI002FDD5637
MDSDQQFCLKWNNHQNTLVSVFDTLLESGMLVDCTVAAEGQYLKAHKVVLSACSPFFERLLTQHCERHPIIILKDVTFKELEAMIFYMYRGKVNICQDQLGSLLKAAESLQIKGLSDSGGGGAMSDEPSEEHPGDAGDPRGTPPALEATAEQKRAPVVPAEDPSRPLAREESSREDSASPVPRKRRKHRRRPSGGRRDDLDQASNSSVPGLPATPPADLGAHPTRSEPAASPKREAVPQREPLTEVFLEPKSEYVEEDEASVEDLTLDDGDDDFDMSFDHAKPGPSQGGTKSSHRYAPWRIGEQLGDEFFTTAQEVSDFHQDTQGPAGIPLWENILRAEGLDGSLFLRGRRQSAAEGSGAGPFVCPGCSRVYLHKCSLGKHQRLECGKAPQFGCPRCPRKFTQKQSLKRHVRKQHAPLCL